MKKKLTPFVIKARSVQRPKGIVFLDRDGVINRFPGIGAYVTQLSDFQFLPGSVSAIKLLTDAGFEVNVISNQGCVSRGLISLSGLRRITKEMMTKVERFGGQLNGIYYCTHQMSDECRCKKPNTTLLKKAVRRRHFSPAKIFFVGDSKEDMLAARNFKCQALLVLSGRTKKKDLQPFQPQPDVVKRNLLDAARWIIRKRF